MAAVLAFGAVTPSHAAISAELAKQCRAMMIKAHPTELFGPAGSAVAQRGYFQECITRQGKMPDENTRATPHSKATTTGQAPPQ